MHYSGLLCSTSQQCAAGAGSYMCRGKGALLTFCRSHDTNRCQVRDWLESRTSRHDDDDDDDSVTAARSRVSSPELESKSKLSSCCLCEPVISLRACRFRSNTERHLTCNPLKIFRSLGACFRCAHMRCFRQSPPMHFRFTCYFDSTRLAVRVHPVRSGTHTHRSSD